MIRISWDWYIGPDSGPLISVWIRDKSFFHVLSIEIGLIVLIVAFINSVCNLETRPRVPIQEYIHCNGYSGGSCPQWIPKALLKQNISASKRRKTIVWSVLNVKPKPNNTNDIITDIFSDFRSLSRTTKNFMHLFSQATWYSLWQENSTSCWNDT